MHEMTRDEQLQLLYDYWRLNRAEAARTISSLLQGLDKIDELRVNMAQEIVHLRRARCDVAMVPDAED